MLQNQTPGVCPVMVTPFTDENKIDYASLERLIDWYIDRGAVRLFAVCQSSEMFFLSLEERVALAKKVIEYVDGRVPVIVSGQISDTLEKQVEEVTAMAACKPEAVILIANRFARKEESDEVWLANVQALMDRLDPSIPLGFYECPAPYRRIIQPETLGKLARTGRFLFLKERLCSCMTRIRRRCWSLFGAARSAIAVRWRTSIRSCMPGCARISKMIRERSSSVISFRSRPSLNISPIRLRPSITRC